MLGVESGGRRFMRRRGFHSRRQNVEKMKGCKRRQSEQQEQEIRTMSLDGGKSPQKC